MRETKESRLKWRYVAITSVFAMKFYFFAIRISLGVSIIAMVNNTAVHKEEGNKSDSCPILLKNSSNSEEDIVRKEYGEFLWSPELQGYILGCSFFSYTLFYSAGGKLIELFGCKNALFVSLCVSSITTFVSPFAAWCHVYLLIVIQILRGLSQAVIVPAAAALVSNWCPTPERGFLYTLAVTGTSFGAMLGSYISGLLCKSSLFGGWPLPFFFFGGTGFIVSLFFGFFMTDKPSTHPKISKTELEYILENQERTMTKERPKTPWCSLLTSIPVYAAACASFGQMWALCHFLTLHPTFLGTILHYSIAENGLFSALPFLLQIPIGIGSGWATKFLGKKNYMSADTARKFWNSISCLGYSACLLGIYFAGCNRPVIVTLSIIALACTGFAFAGCYTNAPDLSPTFAASVSTVQGSMGFTAFFISPLVAGFLTTESQTLEQWHKIIFMAIGIVMVSGVIFAVFGSSKVQPWNDVQEKADEKRDETKF